MADISKRVWQQLGQLRRARSFAYIPVMVVVLLVAVIGIRLLRGSFAATPQYSFTESGLDGGGFQNGVAITKTGSILSAADVSGVLRSTDNGLSYLPSNKGLGNLKVAGITVDTMNGNIYAATGDKGNSGGVYLSTDDGQTWSLRSSAPKFSGNHGGDPLPNNHPRSTGNLIAVDPTNSQNLWAATYNDGLMRSTDGGATWTVTDSSTVGKYFRAVAIDPSDPNTVYAASYVDRSVYVTHAARAAGTFSVLGAAAIPGGGHPEEMVMLGGKLYVAAGEAGIYRYDASGWTDINDGQIPLTKTVNADSNDPYWESITGAVSGGKTILYVGSLYPTKLASGQRYSTVFKSVDGGTSWTSVTGGSQISTNMLLPSGATGPDWWYSHVGPGTLNAGGGEAAQITISPDDPNTVFIAGSGGIWRTTDAGATWKPSVRGLSVTANSDVAVDPNDPSQVLVANTDFVLMRLIDCSGTTCADRSKPSPDQSKGFDVTYDTSISPSTVYVATGDRDVNAVDASNPKGGAGEIYSTSTPSNAASWQPLGLQAATGSDHPRPLAVAAKTISGSPVVVTAVDEAGIWRRANGAWTQVSTAAMSGVQAAPERASFAQSGNVLYLYDRASGVWRSNPAVEGGGWGEKWAKIWSQTSNDSQDITGFVVADPSDSSKLYVSVGNKGVYVLNDADTDTVAAGHIVPQQLGTFKAPGPITLDSQGRLWVTDSPSSNNAASIQYSSDGGQTFTNVTDTVYKGASIEPSGISVAPDGTVYISQFHDGVLVGKPQVTASASVVAESEVGTTSGPVRTQADSSASNGRIVHFGSSAAQGFKVLHSSSSQPFIDSSGTPVAMTAINLEGVFSATGGSYAQNKFDSIRAAGFTAVRLNVFWDFMEPQQQGSFNAAAFSALDTSIARAKAAGLYVIVDPVHLYGTGDRRQPSWATAGQPDSVASVQANAGGYLQYIATRYKDEPAVAAYDLVNEPGRYPIRQNDVLAMYNTLMSQVRSIDPAKIVILEPTGGGTSISGSLANFATLTDKTNVVWSIHDYFAGGDDDGYNADGSVAGNYTWQQGSTGYDTPNVTQLDAHIAATVTKLQNANLPLWIGEFGIQAGMNNHDQWVTDTTSVFRKYGLQYSWWEYWTPDAPNGYAATDAGYNWQPWVQLLVRP